MSNTGKDTGIERIVEIPEGTEVRVDSSVIHVKGKNGEISKEFRKGYVDIVKEGNRVIFRPAIDKKEAVALVGTYASHLKNMIKGLNEGFEYRLKVVYAHFPVKIEVKGDKVVISNFLGERSPRNASICEGVRVDISKEEITVKGIDKEKVGQTAANIERATKIKRKDRRVFQDGVYLVRRI